MWTKLTDDGRIKEAFLDIDDQLIKDVIYDIIKIGDQMNRQTPIMGTMTNHHTDTPAFNKLSDLIVKSLDFAVIKMDNFWGHSLKGDDYIAPHHHQTEAKLFKKWKSFVFYLDVPEGSGEIYFPFYDLMKTPEKKQILVFDEDVMHEVLANYDKEIVRYACSGNLLVSRKSG
jgi:hypothetical protein